MRVEWRGLVTMRSVPGMRAEAWPM
jgi:hypothetical protein